MSLPVLNFNKVSFSEYNRLAHCEKQWDFQYNTEHEFEPTDKMRLGTVLHTMIRNWRTRGWHSAPTEWFDADTLEAYLSLDEEDQTTASWLLARYDEHYGPWTPEIAESIVDTEVHVAAPYKDVILHAYFDELVRDKNDDLWLVERKSMGDWRRLDTLTVDPQITLYVALANMAGLHPKGIVYDAIRTYRWKRDKHPASDSFERVYLDRTDTQIAEALADLDSVLERRRQLREGARPIRNLSSFSCGGCSFKDACYEELAFGREVEII